MSDMSELPPAKSSVSKIIEGVNAYSAVVTGVGLLGLIGGGIIWFFTALPVFGIGLTCFSLGALLVVMLGQVHAAHEEPLTKLGKLWNDNKPIHPLQPPSLPAPDNLQALLKAIEERHELKKLESNLVRGTTESLRAHNDEYGAIVLGESVNGGETFQVITLPFHNSHPKHRVVSVEHLTARLNYHFLLEDDTLRITRGAWLNEKDSKITLGVDETARLIIATIEGARVSAVRRDFDSAHKGIIALREELAGDLTVLEISLISDGQDGPVKKSSLILEVVRTTSGIQVIAKNAVNWKLERLREFSSQGHALRMKAYDIENKSFEAGKAIGNLLDSTILSTMKGLELELASGAADWETRAGDFIGLHFGEQKRKEFLESRPSIDAGLDRKSKSPLAKLGLKPGETFVPIWTLADSINVRYDKLESIAELL